MEFLPFQLMNKRISQDRTDSDVAVFYGLMLKAELLVKLTVAGLVSAIRDDIDRTRYTHIARLARADGIGEWADVLDRVVTGPASQLLAPGIRDTQNQLMRRESHGSWQFQSLSRLNACLKSSNLAGSPLEGRVQFRRWFRDFAALRNGTRGHGAQRPSVLSSMCGPLDESLKLIEENCVLFQLPWAYIRQNLSGKYRVTYWGNSSSDFEVLKRRSDFRIADGVYLDHGELCRVDMVDSDQESSDIWVANGRFNDKDHEFLSYVTDSRRKKSSMPFLTPTHSLPPSETEGRAELFPIGNTLTNLPPTPGGYVGRSDLEIQLGDQLTTIDRHPVVTLTGYGGIGKTSLALNVINQLMSRHVLPFEEAIWFSARDVDLLPTGPKLVRPKGLSVEDFAQEYLRLMGPPSHEQQGWTNESLLGQRMGSTEDTTTLFVFDNFETVTSPNGLYEWIDTYIRTPNKVLITSRVRSFRGDYALQVSGMTDNECSELIETTAESLGIVNRLTRDYRDQVIQQSGGHPYVIKLLLGEFAASPRVKNVRRVIASQDRVLDALFERSYNSLGPTAQQIFLTLASWRSSVPRIALEAVLLRPENEFRDVAGAVDELLRMSFIEEIGGMNEARGELTVPLSARLFGLKKLEISPWRALIKADSELLQLFGAVSLAQHGHDTETRIKRFAKAAADRIERNRCSLDDIQQILEYVSVQISMGWVFLADLTEEFGGPKTRSQVLSYLMRYLENPDSSDHPAPDTWQRVADMHSSQGDTYRALDALAQICRQQEVTTVQLSDAARQINALLRFNDTSDIGRDLREALFRDVVNALERRIQTLDADDCSRLAWLYMNLGEDSEARRVAGDGLDREPGNIHCQRLIDRIEK